MKFGRRDFLGYAGAAMAAPVLPNPVRAQTFPSRTITMIVPFPAGSAIDTVARIIGDRMKTTLGEAIVPEDVTGAAGTIAMGRLARAQPDGYTIAIGNLNTNVINGATYNLNYDLVKDFAPICLLTTEPMLIVARNSMPAKNLLELIAWLKANPDKATGAIGGRADITDVVFALFKKETGTSFQTVPYRGATLALNDLISGQIDLTLLAAGFTLPQIQAGSFKAYAVFAKNRLPQAPDIPTTDEAGLPGFYIPYWSALWAPKNTPRPIIDRLNAAAVDALADPKVRARLTDPGREIYSRDQQTPEALAALQDAEIKKWWPVVKEAGIKAE